MNIIIENITVGVTNKQLINNSDLRITNQNKYGLIGRNGSGKTTLLRWISDRKFDIPNEIDILYVEQEVKADKIKTVFQTVIEANKERYVLMKRTITLKKMIDSDKGDKLSDKIYEEYNEAHQKLLQMNAYKDESIVRRILNGLGFTKEEQEQPTANFSGGWRMRISLARALYLKPTLLLLDEPTNHLDLNANIWLTDYLANEWKNTLIVVSHDMGFLNDVCTSMIHLENCRLTYYKGNYDSFRKNYENNLRHLEKEWGKIQRRIKEMKNKSTPKKIVNEFLENNMDKEPPKPYRVRIIFNNVPIIKTPVIQVENLTFGYNDDKILMDNVDLSVDMGDRYAIVGKNGVGKSTLIKLIMGKLKPMKGTIIIERRARIGYYHQHSSDILPLDQTAVEYLHSINSELKEHDIRKYLGSIGLEGKLHTKKMSILSGGQKARVSFASVLAIKPHVLVLDEPTNHLDIETISALIDGINKFNGGVIMITHNIDLIQKTDAILLELKDQELIKMDFDDYYDKVLEEINDIVDD